MSNALVDNIGNASGSLVTPTQYVVRGSAKAWANLNGTGTIALRDSLNTSSVVDNGTGDYTFNITNAYLNGSNQSIGGACGTQSTGTSSTVVRPVGLSNNAIRIITVNGATTFDAIETLVQSWGDLA